MLRLCPARSMVSHPHSSEMHLPSIRKNSLSLIFICSTPIPGGIGFSEPLFRAHDLLIQKTRELIAACACDEGCPSCVGPAGDLAPRAKEAALAILDRAVWVDGRLC